MKTNKTSPSASSAKATAPAVAKVPSPTRPAAAATVSEPAVLIPPQPHYDAGLSYDTPGLHYAVDETGLPVNDKAKIKLNLSNRTDDDLVPFCQAIITAMAGNANFPTPLPTALVFDAAVADFAAKLQVQRLAKAAALQATNEKNTARALLTELLRSRANYVQTESNGNSAIIMSAAMPLRATPSPVGQLQPPSNLRIDLNGVAGVMILMWDRVAYARSYVVQCADASTSQRVWSPVKTANDRKLILDNMEIGKMYAFRVATIGGSNGQSQWCPEALRMAA
ncbi:MAG: fibronectin type III domain-containing protein [Verrucomicrobiales bacterium]|nr:fibronectin type III domain-containing protein [Verrucomicrobiales bacterium]